MYEDIIFLRGASLYKQSNSCISSLIFQSDDMFFFAKRKECVLCTLLTRCQQEFRSCININGLEAQAKRSTIHLM